MKLRWIRLKARIRILRERILRSIDLRISKLYEVRYFYSDIGTGESRIVGRVLSKNEDLVYDLIRNTFFVKKYRKDVLEDSNFLWVDMAPDCESCDSPVFEDKDKCILQAFPDECDSGYTAGFEIQRIPNLLKEREFRLITGENEYWDLTLLTKAERKILKENPHNWELASQICKAKDWHGWPAVSRLMDTFNSQR